MNSSIDEKILAKYFAEEASIEELTILNDWLQEDDENEIVLQQYHKIWLSGKPKSRFEPDVEKAWTNVAARTVEKRPRNYIAWAAAVAGILLVSTFFLLQKESEPEYLSLKSEKKQIEKTLADGSTITINSFSLLEFPESFNGDERRVKLIGEAFFDITRDESKPFIIEANGTVIKVLGTSFNISARDENVKVSVKSGKVEFSSSPKEKVILQKGEEAVYESLKDTIKSAPILDRNVFAFKTKVFEFKETSLEEVVNVLNKGYQSDVKLEGGTWTDYQITTRFENEKLSDALDIIAQTLELEVVKNDETYVLAKKTRNQ